MAAVITWERLVELEPQLQVLFDEAQTTVAVGDSFCGNAVWYGYGGHRGIKPRLIHLVGWERPRSGDPELDRLLISPEAYDVAYDKISDALPECRECACFGIG